MKNLLIFFVLSYIRFWAKLQLRKINPQIVGVGGSSGKTSTSALIASILSKKFVVKQSRGKNSETGIPLNILGIDLKENGIKDWVLVLILAPVKFFTDFKKYDIYVVEMGIDSPVSPKNMEYLLGIVRPNLGVLTNINIEHSFNFDTLVKSEKEIDRKREILSLIAKEEGLLLKSIDGSGRSIVNIDDINISNLLPLKSKIVTISEKDTNSDFYIRNIRIKKDGFEMGVAFLNEIYEIRINQPIPAYFSYSFVMAMAVGFSFGISVKDSIDILENSFTLPPGRFSIFRGIKSTTIIDSSYNSSFEAAKGAIEAISLISEGRRRVGILGDMRELGSLAKIQHELLAKEILKNLDFAILVGPMMMEYVAPVLEKGNFKFLSFDSFANSRNSILEEIKKDDVILIKGSQNTLFLERAVGMLLADPRDKDKLCRRGKFWDTVRKQS